MSKQLPTIDMILDSSTDEFSSSDEIEFYSPIKPNLIKTGKKCTDTDCYFCNILKSNCTGKDVSVFKNSSKK